MPRSMFQNNSIYQRISITIITLTLLVNCNREDLEQDCISVKGKNCAELKSNGIDESFFFFNDTSWLHYNSYEEKLRACQIPDPVLSEMCTYNLVKTCLVNYPFLLDLTAFNNMQHGFDRYKDAFNGIQTLIARCDGCIELIDYYKKNTLSIHPDSTFTTKNSWGVYFSEIFLAQYDFFGSLSKKERFGLFQLAMEIKIRKRNDDRHGLAGAVSTNWILSRIMVFEKYNPFLNEIDKNQTLNSFVETMNPFELNKAGQIDSLIHLHATNFIELNKK